MERRSCEALTSVRPSAAAAGGAGAAAGGVAVAANQGQNVSQLPRFTTARICMQQQQVLRAGQPQQQQPPPQQQQQQQQQQQSRAVHSSRSGSSGNKNNNAYSYTRLADLRPGVFHVYGIVADFTLPRPTNGTDMVVSLTLIDTSCPTKGEGLSINLFGSSEHHLPKFHKVGDIFRAHRLRVQQYGGKLQGVGKCPGNFSFLLLDGEPGSSFKVRTSSDSYTFTTKDEEIVKALRIWGQHQGCDVLTADPVTNKYLKRIDELQPATFVDLVCKVLVIEEPRPCRSGMLVNLRVWDGTKCSFDYSGLEESEDGSKKEIPRYRLDTRVVDPLSTNYLLTTSTSHLIEKVRQLRVGMWVRFRNVSIQMYQGVCFGEMTQKSSFAEIDPSSPEVVARLNAYRQRDENLREREQLLQEQEATTSVTLHPHTAAPFSTIRDIRSHPEPIGKFRVKATVVGFTPSELRDFTGVSLLDTEKASEKEEPEYRFMFQLTLQDDTGTLPVLVYKEDAVTLFNGVHAVNLYDNEYCFNVVKSKVERLRGAVIDCCIKSYLGAPSEGTQSSLRQRRYRMFDTILLDEESCW